ncbi:MULTISPECIES: DUF2756 family protein [unclassified Cedecea]|jgi:hypothetical protein|uniref:DUF2756 family protein n=1 Tax=Cedecea TaxID=158483 RepID=UPI0012AD5F0D|nr:DUF2756 family protein [Enterobacteriaceae bacterium RIT693]
MKKVWLLAALLPLTALAQPLNTTNNPNQPGYQNPSQQRMLTQMQTQQSQQQGMLKQQIQTQSKLQQQQLQTQLNNNQQRVLQSQPGISQQPLPNTNGGMLKGNNGGMLKQSGSTLPPPVTP